MAEDLKTGDQAPSFDTVDDTGNAVSLSDLKGKRVVLYFYPKDNTPGCTQQACAFRDSYPDFGEKNAVVFGVSPDSARATRASAASSTCRSPGHRPGPRHRRGIRRLA